jgi:hypothetical protein
MWCVLREACSPGTASRGASIGGCLLRGCPRLRVEGLTYGFSAVASDPLNIYGPPPSVTGATKFRVTLRQAALLGAGDVFACLVVAGNDGL